MKPLTITTVQVQYVFSADGAEHCKNQAFESLGAAARYIEKSQRDWLLGALDDFVTHKRKIIEAGKHTSQEKALKIVADAVADFHQQQQALSTIARRTLLGRKYFEAILPHPNNHSHQSSAADLQQLMAFCETVLKQQHV